MHWSIFYFKTTFYFWVVMVLKMLQAACPSFSSLPYLSMPNLEDLSKYDSSQSDILIFEMDQTDQLQCCMEYSLLNIELFSHACSFG